MADYIGYLAPNKTGTTSMTQAFVDAGLLHEGWFWDIPCNGFFKARPYMMGTDYMARRWWEPPNDNITLFSVLRNPWDRLVSGWLQGKKSGWIGSDMPLKEFCDFLLTYFSLSEQHAILTFSEAGSPIAKYFPTAGGENIKTAYRHAMNLESGVFLEKPHPKLITGDVNDFPLRVTGGDPPPSYLVDMFVGEEKIYRLQPNIKHLLSFENLEEDLNSVFDDLNVQNIKLPYLRVSENKKDYRSYYCEATFDFATIYYAWEIELGNYSFG